MRSAPLLLAVALLAGCASGGTRPVDPDVDLYSPSGTRRAQAVQLVADSGDRSYVPELIGLLDDRDETVRLQAHAALKEMTGHDTGYEPFADRATRAGHVEQWRAWWADQAEAAAPSGEGP